jgi:peptidoglycan/LPS O-acetylase OafA/YrhL
MDRKTPTQRFFHIDIIRAIAIIGVMVTHSLALFLGSASVNVSWNYLHFVVVAFVFCSGYVTVYSYNNITGGVRLLSWYKQRFLRLYIPFVLFLITYILIHRLHVSSRYMFDSLTLVGGIDMGWLTLLFLQLTALTPILIAIVRNKRHCVAAITICGIFTLITTLLRIPSSFSRIIAWFPWSGIFLLGAFIAHKEHTENLRIRYFFLAGGVSFFLWLLFTILLIRFHHPLTLTLHKYPPDLYYFLYGIAIISILLGITKLWKSPNELFIRIITFVSKNSYGMFFIHLISLELFTTYIPHSNIFVITFGSIAGTLLATRLWTYFSHSS